MNHKIEIKNPAFQVPHLTNFKYSVKKEYKKILKYFVRLFLSFHQICQGENKFLGNRQLRGSSESTLEYHIYEIPRYINLTVAAGIKGEM